MAQNFWKQHPQKKVRRLFHTCNQDNKINLMRVTVNLKTQTHPSEKDIKNFQFILQISQNPNVASSLRFQLP